MLRNILIITKAKQPVIPTTPGILSSDAAIPVTPDVFATPSTDPSTKVVTLSCPTHQVIDRKIVGPIQVLLWVEADGPGPEGYHLLDTEESLSALIIAKFDEDYLRTGDRIKNWGRYLRHREKMIEGGCCVNDFVVQRTKEAPPRIDSVEDTTCDRCVRSKRVCAKLVDHDGDIKLCIFPLPAAYRDGRSISELGY